MQSALVKKYLYYRVEKLLDNDCNKSPFLLPLNLHTCGIPQSEWKKAQSYIRLYDSTLIIIDHQVT